MRMRMNEQKNKRKFIEVLNCIKRLNQIHYIRMRDCRKIHKDFFGYGINMYELRILNEMSICNNDYKNIFNISVYYHLKKNNKFI